MTSVVSLRTFANSSNVPIVLFVDMQQEYLAAPRLLAISGIERALGNCRKVLDHARQIGLPVAFVRMLNESAFFNRATPFSRWIEGASHALEDVSADEIHRAVSKISGLYADVYETDDWIASTSPRKLGIGKNAGG